MTDARRVISPLLRERRSRPLGGPVLLHRGPVRESIEAGSAERLEGEFTFRLSPVPAIEHDYGGPVTPERIGDYLHGFAAERSIKPIRPRVLPKGFGTIDRSQWQFSSSGTGTRHEIGRGPMVELLVHVLNLNSGRDGHRWASGRVDAVGGGWRLEIDLNGDSEVDDYLRSTGGYEITHIARLTRADGRHFSAGEAKKALETLSWFLTFCAGARVGLALPIGLNAQGRAVWTRWSVTACDRWARLPSWVGPSWVDALDQSWHDFAEAFAQDEAADVLRRAIGGYAAANNPNPIDLSIISAAVVLELLGWFVLYDLAKWLDRSDGGRPPVAAARVRLLLRWAGIDTAVPRDERFQPLRNYMKAGNLPDGPGALIRVRNGLVHSEPPSKKSAPSREVMGCAWALGCWYVELVILRMIGYSGPHQSRVGEQAFLAPVPWAAPDRLD